MYKLIIVEDELFVRIGLENAINWEEYQIEVVGSACNGEEALELYRRYDADIIITDIKMPVMDGIELISEIRKVDKDIKFIILTCMEDFHMAQQAMKYSVSYYFTKYDLKIEDLKTCLVEICKKITSKNEALPFYELQSNEISAEENKVSRFLLGQGGSDSEVMKKHKVNNAVYCTAEILVNLQKGEVQESVGLAVKNVIIQLLKTQGFGSLISIIENRIIILYSVVSEDASKFLSDVASSIGHVTQMLLFYFDLTAYAFVSSIYDDVAKTAEQFLLQQQREHLSFYLPDSAVFYGTDDEIQDANKLVKMLLHDIVECYKTNFSEESNEEFCYFEERIANSNLSDVNYIKELFFYWGQLLMTVMRLPHAKANSFAAEMKPQIESTQCFSQLAQSLIDFIHKIKVSVDETVNMSEGLIKAIDYIRNHMEEPLTLSKISEHVGFSAGYLSYIFKHEINMSFTDFLLKMRIKRAKILLCQTDDKLYRIAELTGFQDASYFNRVFKRIVGVTPNKFRSSNSKGGSYSETE